jgi:hypothetical protein
MYESLRFDVSERFIWLRDLCPMNLDMSLRPVFTKVLWPLEQPKCGVPKVINVCIKCLKPSRCGREALTIKPPNECPTKLSL